MKREMDDDSDVKTDRDRARDDDAWEGDDKKKQRSRRVNNEEYEGVKRSTGESRKRSSGSSRADSDEDEYGTRRESHSKLMKKTLEESSLEKLSNWYQDGEGETKYDSERRKSSSKFSEQESSQTRSKIKDERVHDGDFEKSPEKESRYYERREKTHGSRRRWDEPEPTKKADEINPDSNLESVKMEVNISRSRDSESVVEKVNKFTDTEERRSSDSKRGIKLEAPEEDYVGNSTRDDDVSTKERENLFNTDEDDNSWAKEKNKREVDGSERSRSPERSVRRGSENPETDNDRNSGLRRKEQDRDDKSKVRDDNWSDRNRDTWNKRQSNNDRETKDYDHGREWEMQRRGQNQGRFSGRKDGNREAVKTSSSKYGISNENYDVIEIQTKSFDYARDESRSVQQSDALVSNDEEDAYSREGRAINTNSSGKSGDDDQKGVLSSRGPSHEPSSFNRGVPPQGGARGGSRIGSGGGGGGGGRGRGGRPTGRDNLPLPMMGSPFGPMGMPLPGPMPSLTPNMSPAPGPPMSPGIFIPPFAPPVVWPVAPPGISPGSRFSPNMGTPQNPPPMFFNQPGPGRGGGAALPSISGPNFNALVPSGRGNLPEKMAGGWVPPRVNAPPGRAPSRGEQNDYSQNFVDTGMRPQNFIRELELTSVVEDYPKLRELIMKKDEIVSKSATPPMYLKADLHEQVLSPELFGTKFDVILVDPPWEEYVHRAPGVTDHMEYWTFEEIMNLKIEAIADTPSFIFLWVGDGVGLEQGRQCLKKWGFRRCEDICWVKTNKSNATPGLRHDSHTLFQRSKEHCLMGIKGTVRRSTDGHIIHANIDTDVIIAEEPPYGSTAKPEDMYRIVEHFALGRRRLELFGEDHNIRTGWLTVGKGLSSSNFSADAYCRTFADKDGKVWQGGGGRNPPPEAPHLVVTTPDIEALRPKSPMKNQQQLQQQQSATISLTTATSSNKRPTENYNNAPNPNQEASSSNISTPAHWDNNFKAAADLQPDTYNYNSSYIQQQASADYFR